MAACAYCNTTILFGGKKRGQLRFCNAECESKGALAIQAAQIPSQEVARAVADTHKGPCPKCRRPGPIDVRTSHRVYSVLLFTSWSSRPAICCRRCGIKRNLGDALYSFLLGWWGFPWGLVMTPVQVVRNLYGTLAPRDPRCPSAALAQMVRLQLAAQALRDQAVGR